MEVRSLVTGIVNKVEPVGMKDPRYCRPMDGERVVFHLISRHPVFHYDQDYGCKPVMKEHCDSCPYRFECFTLGKILLGGDGSKLIQIEFKGNTIGIFPTYWRTPEPSANELEAYLWGRSNGRLQMRTSRGSGWR